MFKYVALLRGINVGGKNKIKMKTLREMFAALQFENVRTYINSGNVVFETAKTSDKKLAAEIEKAIESEFSLSIKVIVRKMAEIQDIIKNNPSAGQFTSHKDLHVLFLNEELANEKRELLFLNNSENEQFAVRGREIFCLLSIGVQDSLMVKDYIGKKFKIQVRERNWRTVNKISKM